MCCFITLFLVLASRIAIVVWWLVDPQRFTLAVKAFTCRASLTCLCGPTRWWASYSCHGRPWRICMYSRMASWDSNGLCLPSPS